jgi:hypothetical protein
MTARSMPPGPVSRASPDRAITTSSSRYIAVRAAAVTGHR